MTESFDEFAPSLSPNGRWIAYSSGETGDAEVFVRPFPNVQDGKFQVSTNGGVHVVWAHSGRELFFVDATGTFVAAQIETEPSFRRTALEPLFAVGPATVLTPNANLIDVAPDDQTFLMAGRFGARQGDADHLVLVQNFFEVLNERVPR